MKGLSFEPLLLYPTHYTGEPGYITDTENSEIIKPEGNPEAPPGDTAELPGQKGDAPSLHAYVDEL